MGRGSSIVNVLHLEVSHHFQWLTRQVIVRVRFLRLNNYDHFRRYCGRDILVLVGWLQLG
jgi:hypothetical protein